ncbi:MAG: HEAT repeat domain-containing protein, partial [Verrucomicrobiota bacterium]|nr:HEAT repeat domain-containing protein [Verrucomicrobiota bacterium]
SASSSLSSGPSPTDLAGTTSRWQIVVAGFLGHLRLDPLFAGSPASMVQYVIMIRRLNLSKFRHHLSALAGAALLAMWATGCGGDGAVQAVSKDIDVVALMEQLESTKSADRLNALIELGDGRENSAPALDAILEVLTSDKDAKVREMAAYVLLQMGEKSAKPAIATLKEAYAKEKNPTVKLNIVNAWNAIEPETSPSQGMKATGP